MSADGSTTLLWADGEHRFRLAIGQLRELQEKCDVGPGELLMRLTTHRWRVDDILQTIRLGLIGGGMAPIDALVLVTRYVENRPWGENVVIAAQILVAAVTGDPNEERDSSKKAEAATEANDTSESPSPRSMEPEPPSAGLPERSIN